jgi:hypothetical protein
MDFEEGALRFRFGASWIGVKLDEHGDYRDRIEKLDGTKAVDFIGIYNRDTLFFVEIKDFRGHRLTNETRLRSGELVTEIGHKVRDSLACIVGAYRTASNFETWTPYIEVLTKRNCRVKVVLWLEHDLPTYRPKRRKVLASISTNALKPKLKWLTTSVLVTSLQQAEIPDLEVMNLPGKAL